MESLELTLEEMIKTLVHNGAPFAEMFPVLRYETLERFLQQATEAEISKVAYWWAYLQGHRELMLPYVTDQHWAFQWARDIGNVEEMVSKIIEPAYAFMWAVQISHQEIMKTRMCSTVWIERWNKQFPDYQIPI